MISILGALESFGVGLKLSNLETKGLFLGLATSLEELTDMNISSS